MRRKIAILDDYQNVALSMADWTQVTRNAELTVFQDTIRDPEALVERLQPFDILCVMRERTPLPRNILQRLPNLRLIVSTGNRNASIDAATAIERNIQILNTNYSPAAAIELTWALILGQARNIVEETLSLRSGGWQVSLGTGLRGKTLAVLGLGKIGAEIARIGQIFGMEVIAWSENLTRDRALAAGAELVSKEELFRRADVLSIHLTLGERSRSLVNGAMLGLMKPTAILINTSRGPIVEEAALLAALCEGKIRGAAIDVYDTEPLPLDHPYRNAPRLLATPHIGYVTDDLYRFFFDGIVEALSGWLARDG